MPCGWGGWDATKPQSGLSSPSPLEDSSKTTPPTRNPFGTSAQGIWVLLWSLCSEGHDVLSRTRRTTHRPGAVFPGFQGHLVVAATTMVSKCMVWYGRKRKTEGSCPVGRAISEEVKDVKSELRWVASLLLPMTTVKSGSELLLCCTSGFMALMQLWSLLLLMAPDTIKD